MSDTLPLSPSVTVTTGARLHFGLLVRDEAGRRSYGGLGLMIDQPRFLITVRRTVVGRIAATPDTAARIQNLLAVLHAGDTRPDFEIVVHEELPPHAGLGSGTQLALAVAAALHRLQSASPAETQELAKLTGRGKRSAIGTAGFAAGGLILDNVRLAGAPSQPLILRKDFPQDWRFVLVTPKTHQGLSGDSERDAFRQMSSMDEPQLRQLDDLLLAVLAAVEQHDFAACSETLYEFGRRVGGYFAPYQGGIFADPRMAVLAEQLRSAGIAGVGQTSWGPTLFALCCDETMAETVVTTINSAEVGSDCSIRIVKAKNTGAAVMLA